MNHVSGPLLQFDCTKCGGAVSANAHRNPEKLVEQIADLNSDPDKRICAGCWRPTPKEPKA